MLEKQEADAAIIIPPNAAVYGHSSSRLYKIDPGSPIQALQRLQVESVTTSPITIPDAPNNLSFWGGWFDDHSPHRDRIASFANAWDHFSRSI